MRTKVRRYAPVGGRVDDVRVSGGAQGLFSQTHNGLAVVARTVQLKPGQREVINYDVLSGKAQTGALVLRVTPVTFGTNVVTRAARCL